MRPFDHYRGTQKDGHSGGITSEFELALSDHANHAEHRRGRSQSHSPSTHLRPSTPAEFPRLLRSGSRHEVQSHGLGEVRSRFRLQGSPEYEASGLDSRASPDSGSSSPKDRVLQRPDALVQPLDAVVIGRWSSSPRSQRLAYCLPWPPPRRSVFFPAELPRIAILYFGLLY